ncbi:MAG: hypothetical protein WC346_03505 [Methanogenium sp.]|jgi:hypothetical protein
MSISIEKQLEINKKNEVFTEKLQREEASLIDLTPFETSEYIVCKGQYIEIIEGRTRIAFARCPKCREYISVYEDEIDSKGKTKVKKCTCGFKKHLMLKKWKK